MRIEPRPLPNIKEVLAATARVKVYSSQRHNHGYKQVRIEDSSYNPGADNKTNTYKRVVPNIAVNVMTMERKSSMRDKGGIHKLSENFGVLK